MAQDSIARALALKALNEGGSGGTSDYSELENKPQINSVTLSGNKSLSDLGIQGTLSAGSNITINNGTISATDTTYTAGTGIDITNGVISAEQDIYAFNVNTSISGLQLTDEQYSKVGIGALGCANGRLFYCYYDGGFYWSFGEVAERGADGGMIIAQAYQLNKSTKKFDTSPATIDRGNVFPSKPNGYGSWCLKLRKASGQGDTFSWEDLSSYATTSYVDTAIGGAIGGSY